MMTRDEMLNQKKIEAQLKAAKNAEKTKSCIKAGANLHSQWGRVVTNEKRLIDNGHYMKSNERARLDYLREQVRKAKKENEPAKIVLVKKV